MDHSNTQGPAGVNDAHGFAGMDPDKMRALIREIRAAHHAIGAFAGEFTAPLSAAGISMSTVHQAEHWTHDQISMLTERLEKLEHDEHTSPNHPTGPHTTPNQGTGPHTTPNRGTGPHTTPSQGTGPANTGTGTTGSTAPTGTAASGGTGGSAAPAAAGGAAYGAGAPAGAAGSYVPPSPPAQPAAHAHADVAKHATLDARHVSHAAQHSESLPARVWDDIERNASDPQYALAYLAAIGAAGLAVLGAAIAKSRKKNKDKQEADRRQAALDTMLNSAGAAPSAIVPVTPADVVMPQVPAEQHAPPPGTDAAPAPASQVPVAAASPSPGSEPARPRLRLVTAGSAGADDAASGEPAADKVMGEQ